MPSTCSNRQGIAQVFDGVETGREVCNYFVHTDTHCLRQANGGQKKNTREENGKIIKGGRKERRRRGGNGRES